jgi:hypothetical protein
MSYLKNLVIALLIVFGTAGISLSKSSFQKVLESSNVSINHDEFIYIDNVLYHVFYDDKGNVLYMEIAE